MTNTITNNVTQCSPRQCLEQISAGQSVSDAQGGAGAQAPDTYTECRCNDLFSLTGAAIPIFLWQAVRSMGTYHEVASEFGKPLAEKAFGRLRAADSQLRFGNGDRKEARKEFIDALDFMDAELIEPLELELAKQPHDTEIINDLIVAYRTAASYHNEIRQFNAAFTYYLRAAEYVVNYAKEAGELAAKEGMDRPEKVMGSADVGEYLELVNSAAEAREALALSHDGEAVDLDELKMLYLTAARVLEDNGSTDAARDMSRLARDAELKMAVARWMDDHVQDWRKKADEQHIKKHFEKILNAVRGGRAESGTSEPITDESITMMVKRYIEKNRLELATELEQLKKDGGTPYVRQQMAMVARKLSELHHEVGDFEMAAEWKATEMVYWREAGAAVIARHVAIKLITLAEYADFPRLQGDGYMMIAEFNEGRGEWDRAMASYKGAAKAYKRSRIDDFGLQAALRGRRRVLEKIKESRSRRWWEFWRKGPKAIGAERPDGPRGEGRKGMEREGRVK